MKKCLAIAALVLLGIGFSATGVECPKENVIEKMASTMKSF